MSQKPIDMRNIDPSKLDASKMMATFTNEQIYQKVKEIRQVSRSPAITTLRNTNRKEYNEKLQKQYSDFYHAYPTLFDTLIKDPRNFDLEKLKTMLNLKKKVDTEQVGYEDASKAISHKMFLEYHPHLKDQYLSSLKAMGKEPPKDT